MVMYTYTTFGRQREAGIFYKETLSEGGERRREEEKREEDYS